MVERSIELVSFVLEPLLRLVDAAPQLARDHADGQANHERDQAAGAEQIDDLALPRPEDRRHLVGHGSDQRIAGQVVQRDQAVLVVDPADDARHVALATRERFEAAPVALADAGLDPGMAHQQHAVVAQQRDRAVRSERNGAEELLEVLQLHGAEEHAQEGAVCGGEFAGEKDGPGSGAAILHRLADRRDQIRGRLEQFEVLPVGAVDRRDRPEPGEVDQRAVGVGQSDRIDVRQPADLVPEHQIDVVARHQAPIVFARNRSRAPSCARSG